MATTSAMRAPSILELSFTSPVPGDTWPTLGAVVRSCVGRARRWPVPANWTAWEWMREVRAHGDAAAHEACCQYDSSRGATPADFVTSRVMGRLLTRYRQEWSFASRTGCRSIDAEEYSAIGPLVSAPSDDGMRQSLIAAVNQLSETDRWLVRQIFWQDRNQSELASELGISQPAVSKRYRNIVRQLRCILRTK